MNYEQTISKKRLENRNLLKSLGVFNSYHDCPVVKQIDSKDSLLDNPLKKVSRKSKKSFKATSLPPTRKSSRLLGKELPNFADISDFEEDVFEEIKPKLPTLPKVRIKRENSFGVIPDTYVGMSFDTRMEASHAGIHRPPVAGIHGDTARGCFSLALSGGYEDDVDLGDSFIYTGEGGRDLKGTKTNPKNLRSAPQSKDQVLEKGNLALSKNIENDLPVRVLRGYKLRSPFAPEKGYRYDGLYRVVEYYLAPGLSGFNVYKFRLERIKEQDPAPWASDYLKKETAENESPSKKENVTSSAEKENVEPISDDPNIPSSPEKENGD